jgi:hypothetical protein
MIRKWFGITLLSLVAVVLLNASGCARSQQLQAISIQPSSVTFLSPGTDITFQLKAFGSYIHPPQTKDITSQVTWESLSTDLVVVTAAGVVSTSQTGHCGITTVTATGPAGGANGGVVVASATMTVVDTTNPICPQ